MELHFSESELADLAVLCALAIRCCTIDDISISNSQLRIASSFIRLTGIEDSLLLPVLDEINIID